MYFCSFSYIILEYLTSNSSLNKSLRYINALQGQAVLIYLQLLGEFRRSVQLKNSLSPGCFQDLPFSPADELQQLLFCPGQSPADCNGKQPSQAKPAVTRSTTLTAQSSSAGSTKPVSSFFIKIVAENHYE